ncbi:hypothetical protein AB0907_29485 [Streptomyces sp. NPDC006975]|uniref:hypothetical protein n=1 Tax=Streptomyces sp. NPDC006975 TaxID=3154310 RepID=UPI0034536214
MSNGHPIPPGPYGPPTPSSGTPSGAPGRSGAYGHPAEPSAYGHPAEPSAYGHPAEPGAYAQPGAYGHPTHPGAYAHPAPPAAPYPQPHPPYAPYAPYGATPPYAMPTAVRAAQVVIFVMTGLAVLLTFVVAATVGARPAGEFFGAYLMTIPLFVLAFLYGSAGNGVRVTSVVLASVQIVIALGATANRTPGGILPLAGAIAVVSLLGNGSAGRWFRRPRGVPAPPRPPYA